MIVTRAVPSLLIALGIAASLLVSGLTYQAPSAVALPPAGTDEFDVSGQVNVISRLGGEKITLEGTATVNRGDPVIQGGVEVVSAEIVSLDLQGTSLMGPVSVGMSTNVGPVAPAAQSAAAGGNGDGFEINPTGAFQDGGSAATDRNSGTTTSTSCADPGKDRHHFYAFGLEVPTSANIEGIRVRLDTSVDSNVGNPYMCVELSWDGGTTWTAPELTGTLQPAPASRFLGGPTYGWGRVWSPADLANPNFVMRITNVASDNQRDFSLDYGAVSVFYSAPSMGEIRSLQPPPDQFPASSFFDLFFEIAVPGYPSPTITLHNNMPLRLTPQEAGLEVSLDSWPPTGVTYEMQPLFGVDNDGDTLIDEDGPDDDGDGLHDEDRTGMDPVTPGSSIFCNVDADCDGLDGEDPPFDACTLAVCDNDNDEQMDEDPSCVPVFNPNNRHEKIAVCITSASIQLGGPLPEYPTFSVAQGGPSGFHPADLLALTGGAIPPTASVSGNDAFANAWPAVAMPFTGQQSTTSFTTQAGEPVSPPGCMTLPQATMGHTAWYRITPNAAGTVTASTEGSLYDTVLAAYTGSAVDALALVACNDDAGPITLHSEISFPVTAGTAYYIQAGGYGTSSGNLELRISHVVGPGGGLGPPYVRLPCPVLQLSADGCDTGADGDQDDIDALSFGADFGGGVADIAFSVAPGSAGLANTAVAGQAACSPAQPQADEFGSSVAGSNILIFDGDGQNGACPTAIAVGLQEVPTSDDLDALNEQPPSFVDTDGDGAPEEAVFFSLASGSPTLAQMGRTPADIMWVMEDFQPTLYVSAASLGLQPGDDIDALCLADDGDASYSEQDDSMLFSLAAGSPTLATIGASPADVLMPGPEVHVGAAEVGLAESDDLNAMKCGPAVQPPPSAVPTPTPTATVPAAPSATPPAVATVTPETPVATATATPFGGPAGIGAPGAGGGGIVDSMSNPLAWVLAAGMTGLFGAALIGWGLPRVRRR